MWPSTEITWPETLLESSEIKNEHIFPISSSNIHCFIELIETKSFSIVFTETLGQKEWSCDYGNDWATVSQLKQGFARYFQYQSMSKGTPKNVFSGGNACCTGGFGADDLAGNHGVVAVGQGDMSASDWNAAGNPYTLEVWTIQKDGSILKSKILKDW